MKDQLIKATEEEYKQLLKELLKRIHQVCTENGIRYTAAFGTLLGTVRHQGFIPWDDDVDICMPREDYEKFVEAFSSEDGRYYVLDSGRSEYYYNNMGRACDGSMLLKIKGTEDVRNLGAFVDIYCLDRTPADENEREQFRKELIAALDHVKYALPWKIYRTATFKQKLRLIRHPKKRIQNHLIVGLKKRKAERDALMVRYNQTETGWRNFSASSRTRFTWIMREEDLDKRVLLPFEDFEVYVPEDYDGILKQRYGNYMELPPVEQRVSQHHFTPYWKRKKA